VGNFIGPRLVTYFTSASGTVDFSRMFLIPAGTALVAAILLAFLFHPPEKAAPEEGKGVAPAH